MNSKFILLSKILLFLMFTSGVCLAQTAENEDNSQGRSVYPLPVLTYNKELLKSILSNKGKTTYSYENGRLDLITKPSGITVKFFYNDAGNFKQAVYSNGRIRTALYEKSTGRLLAITSSTGRSLKFSGDTIEDATAVVVGKNNYQMDLSRTIKTYLESYSKSPRRLKRLKMIQSESRDDQLASLFVTTDAWDTPQECEDPERVPVSDSVTTGATPSGVAQPQDCDPITPGGGGGGGGGTGGDDGDGDGDGGDPPSAPSPENVALCIASICDPADATFRQYCSAEPTPAMRAKCHAEASNQYAQCLTDCRANGM